MDIWRSFIGGRVGGVGTPSNERVPGVHYGHLYVQGDVQQELSLLLLLAHPNFKKENSMCT